MCGTIDPGHTYDELLGFACKIGYDIGSLWLKYASHAWYSRLSDKLQSFGFLPSKANISLFHYHKGSITIFLHVYVDDIIIASSSSLVVDALLRDLKSDFP
jgi:hypothetical protein